MSSENNVYVVYWSENQRLQELHNVVVAGHGKDALGEEGINNAVGPQGLLKRYFQLNEASVSQSLQLLKICSQRMELTLDLNRAEYFRGQRQKDKISQHLSCQEAFHYAVRSINLYQQVFNLIFNKAALLSHKLGGLSNSGHSSMIVSRRLATRYVDDALVYELLNNEANERQKNGSDPYDADQDPLLYSTHYNDYLDVPVRIASSIDEEARKKLEVIKQLIIMQHFVDGNLRKYSPTLHSNIDNLSDVLGNSVQGLLYHGRELGGIYKYCEILGINWAMK